MPIICDETEEVDLIKLMMAEETAEAKQRRIEALGQESKMEPRKSFHIPTAVTGKPRGRPPKDGSAPRSNVSSGVPAPRPAIVVASASASVPALVGTSATVPTSRTPEPYVSASRAPESARGSVDVTNEEDEEDESEAAATKPSASEEDMTKTQTRQQNLPGQTATRDTTLREVPFDQIHEAIEQNFYDSVALRIHYKNSRARMIFLGTVAVPIETLVEIETWLKNQFGGGCFRIDPRDPMDPSKRANPIPVFEIDVHGPTRIHPNGSIVPLGQNGLPVPMAGMGGMVGMGGGGMASSGGANPWANGMQPSGPGAPVTPGNLSGQMLGGQQGWPGVSTPWGFGGDPSYGAMPIGAAGAGGAPHTQPVMTFTPDQLAVGELGKAQDAVQRERSGREADRREHNRQISEMNKRIESLTAGIADQRLKEEDRARQFELAALRDSIRRQSEETRALLDAERNKRPSLDLTGLASVIAAVVPVVSALITSGREQTSKSLELQAQGVNNLMKATLERTDPSSKWMDKLLQFAPVVTPLIQNWFESKSPQAQADLVATLSENHLTSLGMMAKFVNEMASSNPEPPIWLPMVQDGLRAIVAGAESLSKSNKASVGIPVAPHASMIQQAQQQVSQVPRMTPAQAAVAQATQATTVPGARGMNGAPGPGQSQVSGQTQVPGQPSPQAQGSGGSSPQVQMPSLLTGEQLAQLVMASPEVPADLKTQEWLHLIARLHDHAAIEEVAEFFANHVRTLDSNLPAMMTGFWDVDGAEPVMYAVFSNLPVWQTDQGYVHTFIKRALELLSEDQSSDLSADKGVSLFSSVS